MPLDTVLLLFKISAIKQSSDQGQRQQFHLARQNVVQWIQEEVQIRRWTPTSNLFSKE